MRLGSQLRIKDNETHIGVWSRVTAALYRVSQAFDEARLSTRSIIVFMCSVETRKAYVCTATVASPHAQVLKDDFNMPRFKARPSQYQTLSIVNEAW